MTDEIELHKTDTTQPEEQPAMAAEADTSSVAQQPETDETAKKLEKMNISFSIWPPTQRTRDAVIKRLIETLSAPSVLSKRYGTIPSEEAVGIANRIEEEAFVAASGSGSGSSVSADDDGLEILQAYSREISKRMLDTVKSRSVSSQSQDDEGASTAATDPIVTEEKATVETES